MKKKTVHRLPPCPSYDVEGMESWLTDLAREDGLFLVKDGIFAGIAEFEAGEPRQDVKYRLEAAPKGTSYLSYNDGQPEREALELAEEYHWEYVAGRGNFHIYRTDDPSARELNTDPEVQAMAINAVKNRQVFCVCYVLFWAVFYPFTAFAHGMILQTFIEVGTWFYLWAALLILWAFIDGAAELVHLSRLVKKLKSGGTLEQKKPWRSRTFPYQIQNFALAALLIAWIIVGLNRWSADVERQHQPSDYQGPPPFATMADFGIPESYEIVLRDWDDVHEWSDWLAPYNLKWSEHAQVQIREGEFWIAGGLQVEYHEMAAPFLARWMAQELTTPLHNSIGPYHREPELPPLDVDYAAAFEDIFPTVVLQKGNIVLKAYFYQTSEETLELEEWVAILAESLGT